MQKIVPIKKQKSQEGQTNPVYPDKLVSARMLYDLFVINTFEEAVISLKNDECVWGPVHTSVGQEAIAAGSVAALTPGDKFFGTHRSHHQFLSKVLQYYLPQGWDPSSENLPDQAITVVKRTLGEIMGMAEGFCGGRGGSMHLRCREAGFLGSNAIVAGGIPLAAGAAFAEKYHDTGQVVVSFFGDGATSQGAFHETMNLASVWQLPLIFFLENNAYAVGTSIKKASAITDFSAFAASYGMEAHSVQGYDLFGIYQLVNSVSERVRQNSRPVFIEAQCYRRYHHAGGDPGSAFKYRSREEEQYWQEREPVANFPEFLLEKKILSQKDIDHVKRLAFETVEQAVDYFTFPGKPRNLKTDLFPSKETVSIGVKSDGREFKNISFSERDVFQHNTTMKYADVIASVTGRWLEKDAGIVVLGEEVANFGGGAYGATKDLPGKYPGRVLNTPISEAGFTGLALGAAMSGMRPVVEIMFPDFTLVAADQVFNQIGKARHMYGNTTDIPLVLRTRIATGCGYGGQHSMDPVGLYALFSGWRIVAPANGFDYIGLFNTAMKSCDPVLVMEHHELYQQKFAVPVNNLDYYIPFGKARIVEEGDQVTIVSYGYMSWRMEKLLGELKSKGVSARLIDLRTVDLPSLDFETIGHSLQKTGVVVIVEQAPANLSIGSKIAAEISERFFDYLDSPVMRLSSQDVPNPVSRVLESAAMISDEEILEMITLAASRHWK
ncbi:MAG: alpha-ketoacid dehydrogenase subunit alpha/beta [Bacteroidales bacterium]